MCRRKKKEEFSSEPTHTHKLRHTPPQITIAMSLTVLMKALPEAKQKDRAYLA